MVRHGNSNRESHDSPVNLGVSLFRQPDRPDREAQQYASATNQTLVSIMIEWILTILHDIPHIMFVSSIYIYHQKYHGMSSSKTYHHHEYSADFHDLQSHFIHFQAFGPSKGAVPNSWMASAKSCRFVWRWVFWNPKHGLCMLINSYEWLGLMVMNDGYWWLWMMVWWLIVVIHGY